MGNTKKYGASARDVARAALMHANGEYGKEVLDKTNKSESTSGLIFRNLHVISAITLDAISDYESGTWSDGGDPPVYTSDIETLVGVEIPANTILYGAFYDIRVKSDSDGIMIAYVDGSANGSGRIAKPRYYNGTVATPVITEDTTEITITCATAGATIIYCIDNPGPIIGRGGASTYDVNSKPQIPSAGSGDRIITYYARATKDGMISSSIASLTFTILGGN